MSEPKENAPWVTFRPEIKVLDCTVRDGGLINAHKFEDNFVKAVYDTRIESGTDQGGTRLQGFQGSICLGRFWRLEILRRGRHPPHRR